VTAAVGEHRDTEAVGDRRRRGEHTGHDGELVGPFDQFDPRLREHRARDAVGPRDGPRVRQGSARASCGAPAAQQHNGPLSRGLRRGDEQRPPLLEAFGVQGDDTDVRPRGQLAHAIGEPNVGLVAQPDVAVQSGHSVRAHVGEERQQHVAALSDQRDGPRRDIGHTDEVRARGDGEETRGVGPDHPHPALGDRGLQIGVERRARSGLAESVRQHDRPGDPASGELPDDARHSLGRDGEKRGVESERQLGDLPQHGKTEDRPATRIDRHDPPGEVRSEQTIDHLEAALRGVGRGPDHGDGPWIEQPRQRSANVLRDGRHRGVTCR